MALPQLHRSSKPGRRSLLLSVLLASAALLATLSSVTLFVAPTAVQLATHALAVTDAAADRGLLVSRRASKLEKQEKKSDPKVWEGRQRKPVKEYKQPFPKYILGFGVVLALIGFAGGGPQLASVFGIIGLGAGGLFEPFITNDGEISGLYDDDDDDE
ncbi:unnamed protein product [Polarella glacialis]|uniref:Uncharacterized protein n=2 Tax=Polarella glacialis TaxID=89957 RepID=A0A813E204_POLGL|nr:unnamed protein product [Polarella glacialis]